MFVSPTEPELIRALGQSTWLPEKYGVDVMWLRKGKKFGVQRKEIKDLLASVADGRLAKETKQMAPLTQAWLIIEGLVSWTLDGMMTTVYGKPWSQVQYRNLIRSVSCQGIVVEYSVSIVETCTRILELVKYTEDEHTSLSRRPGPQGLWGKADNRDYQIHLLQGLPGISVTLAERILDTVGMPFGWGVGKEDLLKVPGLGKKKVDTIWEALKTMPSSDSTTNTGTSRT